MEIVDLEVNIDAVDPIPTDPGQRGADSIVSASAPSASGGDIRNIALKAAFLAAEAGEAVRMAHLLSAARREYDKLERALSASEIRGWT